jgi:hypothetical protein
MFSERSYVGITERSANVDNRFIAKRSKHLRSITFIERLELVPQ